MAAAAAAVPSRTASARRWRPLAAAAATYAGCLLLAAVFMVPFLWTISTSFKSPPEIFVFPPAWLPETLRWQNYPQVWQTVPYGRWAVNSAVVTVLSVVGQTLASMVVAYGFARFRFPGRDVLFLLTLATLILPREVTIIPTFLLFRQLGWIDTLLPLVVPYWFGGGPFYIFLLRQFILSLPRDLDEAAKIDGAGALQTLWRVIVPLSQPALATAAILGFLHHWNEYLEPLVFLNSNEQLTLPVGLRSFQLGGTYGGEPRVQLLMAASLMMALPCVVLFFVGQRYFVRGVVMSGLKG